MKVAGGKEEGSPGKGFPPGRLLSKAKPVARHLFPPAATEPRHDVAKETQSLVPAQSRQGLGPKAVPVARWYRTSSVSGPLASLRHGGSLRNVQQLAGHASCLQRSGRSKAAATPSARHLRCCG